MKCLETEELIDYAYRLAGEPAASRARAHLGECSRCRKIVQQHGRLDSLLNEWTVAEPAPDFDLRVRQAVGARQRVRFAWSWGAWQWVRGWAMASLAMVMVAGLVWFAHSQMNRKPFSRAATGQAPATHRAASNPQTADLHSPAALARAGGRSAHIVPKSQLAGVVLNEDKDAQALEDYDLAANFDLLSELPKSQPRVAN